MDAAQPWQLTDLKALDEAWLALAEIPNKQPQPPAHPQANFIQRAYVERPRGHSKTSDIAMQIAWIMVASTRPLIGLAAASDRDQANFIHDSVHRLAVANPELLKPLTFIQHRIRNIDTGSRLDVISSDVSSSFGALPDFVVCDEICHWTKPDLWHSLLSSAAKKPDCVLTVLTNAGIGKGWQWEIREHARTQNTWHFSSLNGPHAPWITDDWLTEQRALLPEPVFERLWLNIWQQSDGNFVTLAEAEACRDENWFEQEEAQPGCSYVGTIDYAEKRDFTVGCVAHLDGDVVVVDRMDVVKPTPSQTTPVQWVEDWIESMATAFPNIRFVIDDYQLVGTVQNLESRFPIERFKFSGENGNHRLASLLRHLILHERFRWFANCGAVPSEHRDDLETELSSLLLIHKPSGNIRINHVSDGKHHDDRAFALGVAALTLCKKPEQSPVLDITPPSFDGTFGWSPFTGW